MSGKLLNEIMSFEIQRMSSLTSLRLQLHGAIYRPDSFVSMLRYCANLKAIIYESMSLNRIVADKSHRVIVALSGRVVRSFEIREAKATNGQKNGSAKESTFIKYYGIDTVNSDCYTKMKMN